MNRVYKRFVVIGTEKLDHGSTIKYTETGICLEDQDPLQIAMARNNKMLRCHKYKVEVEPAFHINVFAYRQKRREEIMKRQKKSGGGYRDLMELWSDPEFPKRRGWK